MTNNLVQTSGQPALESQLSYSRADWSSGYRSQPGEFSYWIEDIEGEIPTELRGTLFRNGPGLLEIQGQRLHHPFDGDGLICSFAIAEGRAYFRNRFVRTPGFVEEQKVGKVLYRGTFGTQKPGGWLANLFDLRLKNIANTNVMYWGEKLLAMWEAAEPFRLDPRTLETLGPEYLEGVLQPGSPFSAHPRLDPSCDRLGGQPCLVNFATKPGLSTSITIYELNLAGQVVHQHAHTVPGFAFLHDFAITPNYCIFFQNPVSFNPLPYLLGWQGAAQCIQFQPQQPTRVIVIPRDGQQPMQVLETEPCFVFHHANAWEDGDRLIVDSVCYESFPGLDQDSDYHQVKFDTIPAGELWRFELNLTKKTVQHQVVLRRCCEFPTLQPSQGGRSYRYLYIGTAHASTGNAPLQAILKYDWQTGQEQLWSAAPRGFVGEPVFVPRPGATAEDDGWLLTLIYNAERAASELVILSAADLTAGPLAWLRLPHHIPYGLHGNFTPEYFGPNDFASGEIQRM